MSRSRNIGAMLVLLAVAAMAQHKSSTLDFLIVKDANGKPVRNAEIVLHPVDKNGRQKDQSVELKTHEDGKASVNGIPYGKLRVQVIAQGFKTYGEDYDISQPNHAITIKLQKPAEQYSIYK
jgi:5-hydroxyisourate hydrolase-like protein (transthyretin family)